MQRKYSVAESFATLSIGLWAVSLIGYITSGASWMTYFLIVVGVISVILALYFVLPQHRKQELFLKYLDRNRIIGIIKLLLWLLVLVTFGIQLVQTEIIWMVIVGVIIAIIAFAVFNVGLWRMNRDK